MKSCVWLTCFALAGVAGAWADPVAFRLASLPASAEPGQRLVLCAANIGTGALDVTLEFLNVKTAGVVAETTVRLSPLGAGSAAQPCVTTTAEALATAPAANGEALVVGVAMVRKPLLSFREAQVTASIQVMAPDADGAMRTVQTIPLSRAGRPSDGGTAIAPASAGSGHHK
jgi:hypothetical protein